MMTARQKTKLIYLSPLAQLCGELKVSQMDRIKRAAKNRNHCRINSTADSAFAKHHILVAA